MKSIQKSLMTLVGVLTFLAALSAGDELVTAPVEGAPVVLNAAPLDAAPVTLNAAPAPSPVNSKGPGPILATVMGPELTHPTGEAITTETRNPDGTVVTVTRFNGQIPHTMFQNHFPGIWSPFQYGLHRPYYNYPI